MRKNKLSGFTLIELVILIVLISILSIQLITPALKKSDMAFYEISSLTSTLQLIQKKAKMAECPVKLQIQDHKLQAYFQADCDQGQFDNLIMEREIALMGNHEIEIIINKSGTLNQKARATLFVHDGKAIIMDGITGYVYAEAIS